MTIQDVSSLDVCQDDCVCLCCSDGGPVWAHDVTPLADPRTWQDDVVDRFNDIEQL